MNHRERVLKALNHEEPDRVPLDLGGSCWSMVDVAYYNLKKYLHLGPCDDEVIDRTWNLVAKFDERILEYFDIDIRRIYLREPEGYEVKIGEDKSFIDKWGFKRRIKGPYSELIDHPLRYEEDINTIKKFKFFNLDNGMTKGLKNDAEYLKNNTDYAIAARKPMEGILEIPMWIRGFEQFLMDVVLNKKLVEALIGKVTDFAIEIWSLYLTDIGGYLDMVEFSDDISSQNGLLFSPELYKELVFPHYKRLLSFIKSKTKAKIVHHCCGTLATGGLQNLIDSGIDVLESLQPMSKNMDTTYVKDNFGSSCSFLGGVDIQYIIPFGTTKDVEKEVKRRIAIWAPGGGYIFGPTHELQPDSPPENIVAMYETAKKYGKYPLCSEIVKLRDTISKEKYIGMAERLQTEGKKYYISNKI